MLVVGGPNGSGKTTVAIEYVSRTGFDYLSADAIALTIAPDHPERVQVEAGRQFIHHVDEYIADGRSFVAESTLSGRTMRNVVKAAQVNRFTVDVAFLFVDSADICVARVAERARKGGHSVPEVDIRRRYSRAIRNFWNDYRELADSWVLMYNGDNAVQVVALGTPNRFTVRDSVKFDSYMSQVGYNSDA
jgi:predicted ABC-type ATPase